MNNLNDSRLNLATTFEGGGGTIYIFKQVLFWRLWAEVRQLMWSTWPRCALSVQVRRSAQLSASLPQGPLIKTALLLKTPLQQQETLLPFICKANKKSKCVAHIFIYKWPEGLSEDPNHVTGTEQKLLSLE